MDKPRRMVLRLLLINANKNPEVASILRGNKIYTPRLLLRLRMALNVIVLLPRFEAVFKRVGVFL